MNDDSIRQSVLFAELGGKPLTVKFDQPHASSDGGAILLQACDRRLGLTEALVGAIHDRRQSGKVRHAIGDLVRQRLYAIGCGYPDGNDASRLGGDPIQKLLGGRDSVRGEELASQPTLSRFENAFTRADLYRMGIALAESVIERHRRRLKAQGQAHHDRSRPHFSHMVSGFRAARGWSRDIPDGIVSAPADGQTTATFLDSAVTDAFRAFFHDQAMLRILCREANLQTASSARRPKVARPVRLA